jgi:hypothetical protein
MSLYSKYLFAIEENNKVRRASALDIMALTQRSGLDYGQKQAWQHSAHVCCGKTCQHREAAHAFFAGEAVEATPGTITSPPPSPASCSSLSHLQRHSYAIREINEDLLAQITKNELPSLSEKDMYEVSLKLQPRV